MPNRIPARLICLKGREHAMCGARDATSPHSTAPMVLMPVTFSGLTMREAIDRWMPSRMSGVGMPRLTLLVTSVSASTAPLDRW